MIVTKFTKDMHQCSMAITAEGTGWRLTVNQYYGGTRSHLLGSFYFNTFGEVVRKFCHIYRWQCGLHIHVPEYDYLHDIVLTRSGALI